MKKKRTFWDGGSTLGEKLDSIPENEMSTIIRMALRQWFGLPNSKPKTEPVTQNDAKQE